MNLWSKRKLAQKPERNENKGELGQEIKSKSLVDLQ
jgi:hypothetical protein